MSAAVMSASAVFDFENNLLKSSGAVRQHGVHGVRWGERTVVDYQRESLSRRASQPLSSAQHQQQQHQGLGLSLAHSLMEAPAAPPATPTLLAAAHRKLDRSHSEPANPNQCAAKSTAAASAAAAAAANINTSRYKTELCRPFEESGSCKYGDKCQFAHGAHELRTLVRHPKYKTELCRTYHTIGLCPYGPRCHFVHNDEESLAQHAKPTAGAVAVQPSAAAAVAGLVRPKVLTLATAPPHSPAHSYLGGSTADSPSPTSSLSQSPTNSHRSFFMSSEDVFGSVSPTPTSATANTAFSFGQDFGLVHAGGPMAGHHVPCGSTGSGSSRDSPSPPGSPFRLPIFNTLSNQVMKIRLDV